LYICRGGSPASEETARVSSAIAGRVSFPPAGRHSDLAELKADIFRPLVVHELAVVVATVSLVKFLS
jgi:hypothetical protein